MDHFSKRIREFLESIVLFTSVVKWFILASIVGIIVGAATSFFLLVLEKGINIVTSFDYYYYLLPLSIFLSSLLVYYLAPDAVGHGTERVIRAIHKRAGRIKFSVIPVKFVATIITVSTGGSAGKEGPCAQIGGGLASAFADLLRFGDNDRKKLVICGISAGFSAVFGTPIAGAMFGIEVLYIGNLFYDALMPSFVSGIISYHMAQLLGITFLYHPLGFAPVFSGSFIVEVVIAGIFFGLVSFVFIEVMELFNDINKNLNIWTPLKGIIGGVLLTILTLLFTDQYLGLGLDTITDALSGRHVGWCAFAIKMFFTAITLNFGGSGGIVTPIFFIGAASGSLFGDLMGLDRATFAAIGLVGVLAGAANTPVSASIMAIELFGAEIAPYAALVCVISYLITGHRSVYPTQIIVRSKSPSVEVETGKEIEEISLVTIRPRSKTLYSLLIQIFETAKRMVKRAYEHYRKRK